MATVDEVIDGHLWAALFDIIDKEYLRYMPNVTSLRAFFKLVKNGDGYLSWEEFTSHADLENQQEVLDAIELFKAADSNGDGKVSKEEFIKLMSDTIGGE